MTILYAVILFALLIFPHELGHFLVAKAVGVRVNEFAFGVGPALFRREKGETTYVVRLIPLGGYCAMDEGEDGEDGDDSRSFHSKSMGAKLAVLIAGSATNVCIALLVLSLFAGVAGMLTTELDEVQADSPAQAAGLQAGDRICAIDGTAIDSWSQIPDALGDGDAPRQVELERDGERLSTEVTPVYHAEEDRYVIGITPRISHSPLRAVRVGAEMAWEMTCTMFDALRQLITGQVSADQLAGPVGVVSMAGETSRYGVSYFVNLLALLSLNLAIINLLPIPALDGGRILLILVRRVTGHVISDRVENGIHAVGMLLLLGLMVFVTWNDIVRLLT